MKIYHFLLIAILFSACSNADKDGVNADDSGPADTVNLVEEIHIAMYGDEITEEGAIPASDVLAQLAGADSVKTKLVGSILKVCQAKGCWMSMKVNEEQSMHVSFKDYGFFVPKDIDGKETVIEGYAYMETMSVDELKHYAEDEGKSQEEIDAITEPETNLSFVANGVIVKDYEIATAE